MAAYHLFWVDVNRWELARGTLGSAEAESNLGSSLAALFQIMEPDEVPDGVGVLGGKSAMTLEGPWPRVVQWGSRELAIWHTGQDLDEIDAVLALNDPPIEGSSPVLIGKIDADEAEWVDVHELGRALFNLMDHPLEKHSSAGRTYIHRCAMVDLHDSCILVWTGGHAFTLSELDPAMLHRVRAGLGPRNPQPPPAGTEGTLSLAGFILRGDALGTTFIPAGPGAVTIFFGRNGAGKTLFLEAILSALGDAAGDETQTTKDRADLPACDILLSAASQESSTNLFRLVLAHAGWSPLAPVTGETQRALNRQLPSWSDLAERPAEAIGLTPLDLIAQPIEELRDAMASALLATTAWGSSDHAKNLVRSILSASAVALTADGDVGLAVFPGNYGDDLRADAQRLLDQTRVMTGVGLTGPVDLLLFNFSTALVARQDEPLLALQTRLVSSVRLGLDVSERSDWLQLGRLLGDSVRNAVPRPVAFTPSNPPGSRASDRAEAAILQVLASFDRRPVSDDAFAHAFVDDPLLEPVVQELNRSVNSLLPKFVSDAGSITVSIAPSGQWHSRRTYVMLVDAQGNEVSLDEAPAGFRTWGIAALGFAEAHLLASPWSATHELLSEFVVAPGEQRVQMGRLDMSRGAAFEGAIPDTLSLVDDPAKHLVYLLDEPEAHLHLTAQQDIADTAFSLAEQGQGALVATHSLAFVDKSPGRSMLVTLVSTGDGIRAELSTGMNSLNSKAEQLGIRPSALAQACQAVLVVEGKNDVEILRRFGGIDLDQHFIVVCVLQGHFGVPSIAELEFVHTLQIPIVVMLDHVRRSVLVGAIDGRGERLNAEEKSLIALHQALVGRRLGAFVLPFASLDIVCAVPDDQVQWALDRLGGGTFAGWKKFEAQAADEFNRNRTKFKEVFRAETGFTVEKLIDTLVDGDRTGHSPVLHAALSSLVAGLSDLEAAGLEVLQPNPKR